jgi:hypothetical protein
VLGLSRKGWDRGNGTGGGGRRFSAKPGGYKGRIGWGVGEREDEDKEEEEEEEEEEEDDEEDEDEE